MVAYLETTFPRLPCHSDPGYKGGSTDGSSHRRFRRRGTGCSGHTWADLQSLSTASSVPSPASCYSRDLRLSHGGSSASVFATPQRGWPWVVLGLLPRSSSLTFQWCCKPLNSSVKPILLKISGVSSGSCPAPAASNPDDVQSRGIWGQGLSWYSSRPSQRTSEFHVPGFMRAAWHTFFHWLIPTTLWGKHHRHFVEVLISKSEVREVCHLPEATELGSEIPSFLQALCLVPKNGWSQK